MLALSMPVANRLIGVEKSGVELSLVMFDLGGITEHSGTNVFPPLRVRDPVRVNHHCYSPVKWDPYSWWVDEPCPLQFYTLRDLLKAQHRSGVPLWLGAVLAHPIAYAEHRLIHFNINSRFLVHDEIERPVQNQSAPNDWHFTVGPNRVLDAIDAVAVASASSPLGWPIWWLAVALGALILAPAVRSRRLVVPLSLSSLLYGFGYVVFSVAAEMRYHLWTMLAAALAAVIAVADSVTGNSPTRRRLVIAAAPACLVAVACIAARLV
jgi:hypothetical protein